VGWDGLSFAVLFPVAVGLLGMNEFSIARIAFAASSGALAIKLVLSSLRYLQGPWKLSGSLAALGLAAIFLILTNRWVSQRQTVAASRSSEIVSQKEPLKSLSATNTTTATLPEISLLGYEVILFKPKFNPFANVFMQNIGGEGTITVYSSSGLSPTTANPIEIRKELERNTKNLVSGGGGLVFSVQAQEKRWFTVMGPDLSAEQAKLLKGGKYFFYFTGTILVNGMNSNKYDFCSFVRGDRPNVVLQCPEK
jgi:hypothetical protein